MDTTQLLKGVLDVAVLAVITEEDGYGYDVVRRLRSSGLASPQTLSYSLRSPDFRV